MSGSADRDSEEKLVRTDEALNQEVFRYSVTRYQSSLQQSMEVVDWSSLL